VTDDGLTDFRGPAWLHGAFDQWRTDYAAAALEDALSPGADAAAVSDWFVLRGLLFLMRFAERFAEGFAAKRLHEDAPLLEGILHADVPHVEQRHEERDD